MSHFSRLNRFSFTALTSLLAVTIHNRPAHKSLSRHSRVAAEHCLYIRRNTFAEPGFDVLGHDVSARDVRTFRELANSSLAECSRNEFPGRRTSTNTNLKARRPALSNKLAISTHNSPALQLRATCVIPDSVKLLICSPTSGSLRSVNAITLYCHQPAIVSTWRLASVVNDNDLARWPFPNQIAAMSQNLEPRTF